MEKHITFMQLLPLFWRYVATPETQLDYVSVLTALDSESIVYTGYPLYCWP